MESQVLTILKQCKLLCMAAIVNLSNQYENIKSKIKQIIQHLYHIIILLVTQFIR